MIEKALQYTRDSFNQYLTNMFGLDENPVILNRIVDPNGGSPLANTNKVVISLIHLEQETNQQYYNKLSRTSNGKYVDVQPSQRYNIFILVVPNYEDYEEGLKFLNASMLFFQANPILDGTTNANIPKGIQKLEFQLETGDSYVQMQNIWTALGAKYQPSLIYRMKLIDIDASQIDGFDSQVSQLSNTSDPV